MPTELVICLRFLREGRSQTALILSLVAVGVAVIVFLSALITGLQASLLSRTVGSQPHVVISPMEEVARPQLPEQSGTEYLRRVERPTQRLRSIPGWQQLLDVVAEDPGVLAASPLVAGPGLAVRGGTDRSVTIMGVRPEAFDRVIPTQQRMLRGAYDVSGAAGLIGSGLAEELGADVGDRLRIVTAKGRRQLVEVHGVFEIGNAEADQRWVIVSLRTGQTLLDLSGGVSRIDLRVDDVFGAEVVARRLETTVGLPTTSWQEENEQLLVALESQSYSSDMIQFFIILAVAMGIASVLAVSVVQKRRQIGILRAMGASRAAVQRLFLYQGAIVGLIGSAFGVLFGWGLSEVFVRMTAAADGSPLFPFDLGPERFALAIAVATITGILSGLLPARQAARLEPVVAIRAL